MAGAPNLRQYFEWILFIFTRCLTKINPGKLILNLVVRVLESVCTMWLYSTHVKHADPQPGEAGYGHSEGGSADVRRARRKRLIFSWKEFSPSAVGQGNCSNFHKTIILCLQQPRL